MNESSTTAATEEHARPGFRHSILGRLAVAVRQQNWFAVALEVLIVITGVVIGFQITAWGQRKSDRARELAYLQALVVDLQSDTAQIRTAMALSERRARLGHDILDVIAGTREPSPGTLAPAVEESMWFNFPAYTMTTISELQSTGNLRLIQNDALRRRLSAYYRRIELLDQWSGNWRRIQMDLEAVLPEVLDVRDREAITAIVNRAPALPWVSERRESSGEAEGLRRRLRMHDTYHVRLKGMIRIHGTLYSHLRVLEGSALEALEAAEAEVAAKAGA